ncbi:MAG: hypothetical protein WBF88_17645 [Pusillimonas sp.]
MSKDGWKVYHKPIEENGVWTIKEVNTVTGEEAYHEYASELVANGAYQSLNQSLWESRS